MVEIRAQAASARRGALDRIERADCLTAAVLHERYLEDVFRYVLRRVPRWEEAQDITAQVFAAAFVGLPRFRGDCSPYLWLLGIARRQIAAALRRRAARPETLASELPAALPGRGAGEAGSDADPLWAELAAAEGPEAALMRAEAQRVLRELVAGLPADQQEALMLHYMEQLSVAEIAVVMGRSPTSVKGLVQRARATLHRQGRAYFLVDEDTNDERARANEK
jgi:RNA polymerase sigma-70 factor (ECF subfamily)